MYKQYVWSFDDEYFNSDMFDTKEECLNDAKKYVAENGDEGDYFEVYIAEVKEWNVTCDSLCVDDILDRVAEDAFKIVWIEDGFCKVGKLKGANNE
jgi:hypothetical protein